MGLMYYLVFCLIAIVFLGIFLPDGIGGEIHNPYLLIFLSIMAITILAVKFFKYLHFCLSVKSKLKKQGYEIIHFRIMPIFLRTKQSIIAKSKEKTVNVSLIYVTGKHLTYHFESIYKLELYKSTRLAIKPRVRQANIISSKVKTRRVSTKNLKWDECADKEQIKLVVFNAFSNLITDTYSHEGLYYGDKISKEAYLYDLKHLDKFTDL